MTRTRLPRPTTRQRRAPQAGGRTLKLLFFMTHPGFTRNFASTIALLAERGHRVHLAFDGPPQIGKPSAVDALAASSPRITYGGAPDRDDLWSPLLGGTRALRNALRYLQPRYRASAGLRARAVTWPLGPVLAAVASSPLGSELGLRLLDRLLRALQRAVPSSPAIERFIRDRAPDAVLLTPVVDFHTPQPDQLASARALGIPTGVLVASWDNLTNKGLIQGQPDLVTVWNEHQRSEAIELHGIAPERVVVTGAQIFDEWFTRRPSTTRDAFCARLGLDPARPLVLYACSSQWIAPAEVPFAERWLRAVRAATGPLGTAGVLIRPHPQNADQWRDADLSSFGSVAVWPREPAPAVDEAARADFYDSLYHSAAVVGINTSALIEAGIVGRPVFTILDAEFRDAQEGTLHFRYLVEVSGGLPRVAWSLDEHAAQLGTALASPDDGARGRAFVASFVRPHGLDLPAAPILADAIERLAARPAQPDRPPAWAAILRWPLYLAAIAGRAFWDGLKRAPRSRPSPAGRPSPPASLRDANIGVHLARDPSASPDPRVADIISRARARGGRTGSPSPALGGGAGDGATRRAGEGDSPAEAGRGTPLAGRRDIAGLHGRQP